MRTMTKKETRNYEITATPEQLDILETLFQTMQTMGKQGASRAIKLYVDGDGAFHPQFRKYNYYGSIETEEIPLTNLTRNTDKEIIKHGHGYIHKNCKEFKGEGIYIYYDFG